MASEWQDCCNEKEYMKFALGGNPLTAIRNYDGGYFSAFSGFTFLLGNEA
jgi:hypothetical protein